MTGRSRSTLRWEPPLAGSVLEIQFLQIRQVMSHCTARPDMCPCMAQTTWEKATHTHTHAKYLKTAIKINVLCTWIALNKSSVCLLYMHKEANLRTNTHTDRQTNGRTRIRTHRRSSCLFAQYLRSFSCPHCSYAPRCALLLRFI